MSTPKPVRFSAEYDGVVVTMTATRIREGSMDRPGETDPPLGTIVETLLAEADRIRALRGVIING